jgi:phosphatidylserine decarboxylase
MACDAHLRKGQEMGWFEHGSTAILFAPEHYTLCVAEGATIRMGEPLMRLAHDPKSSSST